MCPVSASRASGSASSRALRLCSKPASLLMLASVSGCLLPSVSRRAASASRNSGSASSRRPLSCSKVAKRSIIADVPRSFTGIVSSAARAALISQPRSCCCTALFNAPAPPSLLATAASISSLSRARNAVARRTSTRARLVAIEAKSRVSASKNLPRCTLPSATSYAAPVCEAQKSSHRHHERVSGSGSFHGSSTAATRPMSAIDCLNSPLHQSCSGSGRALPQSQPAPAHMTVCWFTVRMSSHCARRASVAA